MSDIRSTLNTPWGKHGAAPIDSDPLAAFQMDLSLHQVTVAAFEAPLANRVEGALMNGTDQRLLAFQATF